jgi:hypothetical protein
VRNFLKIFASDIQKLQETIFTNSNVMRENESELKIKRRECSINVPTIFSFLKKSTISGKKYLL